MKTVATAITKRMVLKTGIETAPKMAMAIRTAPKMKIRHQTPGRFSTISIKSPPPPAIYNRYPASDFIWGVESEKDSLYETALHLKEFADELFEETDIKVNINGFK